MNTVPGVDMSTGSLGQGVSAACGMALAARQQGKSSRVYTLLGDGEIQEGQVWEAMMFAHHYKLDNLCVIIDNNGLQIDGNVADVMSPIPSRRSCAPSALRWRRSTAMILSRSRPPSPRPGRPRASPLPL